MDFYKIYKKEIKTICDLAIESLVTKMQRSSEKY